MYVCIYEYTHIHIPYIIHIHLPKLPLTEPCALLGIFLPIRHLYIYRDIYAQYAYAYAYSYDIYIYMIYGYRHTYNCMCYISLSLYIYI